MKKLISFALALTLVLSLGTLSAFAAEGDIVLEYDQSTATSNISYVVDPSYTVTIPGNVSLNPTSKSATLPISAEDVNVVNALTVSITGWSNDGQNENVFALASTSSEYIPCTVTVDEASYTKGSAVLTVSGNETSGSASIEIAVTNTTATYSPVTYTGTMDFTLSCN